ncbi:hypothetical protein D9758_005854 [Tetrapyrgos nigripes]|uniref:Uncharacterized protein n=1 Tax=Tetrapyrgos nigripes TaxID=182062 RepID=A0A8H5G335_9AGAR|nr:hypothetical protein D9758_005854 [Tetrapyrgos nigripes]
MDPFDATVTGIEQALSTISLDEVVDNVLPTNWTDGLLENQLVLRKQDPAQVAELENLGLVQWSHVCKQLKKVGVPEQLFEAILKLLSLRKLLALVKPNMTAFLALIHLSDKWDGRDSVVMLRICELARCCSRNFWTRLRRGNRPAAKLPLPYSHFISSPAPTHPPLAQRCVAHDVPSPVALPVAVHALTAPGMAPYKSVYPPRKPTTISAGEFRAAFTRMEAARLSLPSVPSPRKNPDQLA